MSYPEVSGVTGHNLTENEYDTGEIKYALWTHGDQLSSPPIPICLWSRWTCNTI